MRALTALLVLGVIGAAVYELAGTTGGGDDSGDYDSGGGPGDTAGDGGGTYDGADMIQPGSYAGLENYQTWQPNIDASTAAYGLPDGLLDRLLFKESSYRSDVIDGAWIGGSGDAGIAQFIPSTAASLGIDPLDPAQAIDGAGRYLAQLFGMFGSWPLAVAAYNAGPGTVQHYVAGARALPAGTLAYVQAITGTTLA